MYRGGSSFAWLFELLSICWSWKPSPTVIGPAWISPLLTWSMYPAIRSSNLSWGSEDTSYIGVWEETVCPFLYSSIYPYILSDIFCSSGVRELLSKILVYVYYVLDGVASYSVTAGVVVSTTVSVATGSSYFTVVVACSSELFSVSGVTYEDCGIVST